MLALCEVQELLPVAPVVNGLSNNSPATIIVNEAGKPNENLAAL